MKRADLSKLGPVGAGEPEGSRLGLLLSEEEQRGPVARASGSVWSGAALPWRPR
ncbi:hypothetical protein [Paraliomyxa miuraensis]|uniref:hypothetical protein n=1 Tax=Paraliomyxa miuraensis TaxID=376150 RepID=UPI0022508AD7|nr:hypothetical protein [Paraliomyxa miuraensis]MCX4247174.1 hypothetical protein [Paraliomyxa miuraensis]